MSDLTTFCDIDNNTVGFAVAAYVQTIDPVTCATSYSLVSEYYDTDFVSVGTSLPSGWQQCCCESGGGNAETVTTVTDTITGNKIGTYTNELGAPVDINETITSLGTPTIVSNVLSIPYTNETGVTSSSDVNLPTLCDNISGLPTGTFNALEHQFVVKNTNTQACERVFPSFPGANWAVTRTVGGLQSAQNMVQTAPSTYQNFPSTHLQGNFTVPSVGGFSNTSNVRLDFNFNLMPSTAGATYPAGAWANRYVIDLRVRLDGVNITHVIRTLASTGEMGTGIPLAFTAYPEYDNYHLSVLLGTAVAPGAHTFAVQYSVFSNTVTTGHTRTVQIGWSDWMIESNYV